MLLVHQVLSRIYNAKLARLVCCCASYPLTFACNIMICTPRLSIRIDLFVWQFIASIACRFAPHKQDPLAHRNLARLLDATGNTRDSLTHNRIAVRLGPGHLTEGRVRDAHDTDTYRTVARQTVARNECVHSFLFRNCICLFYGELPCL